ncbi:FMN-dependent NADH-azoreductase [Lysinibacillus sp. LZ02]|uniref:FMN-dependent NADH-azoreductase n=1 Tax=Lysinibacillus sp. LZ02 TaxID=3420668 RepID=UPI003D35CAE5
MNVLVVKANNRPDGVSTRMYEVFIQQLEEKENIHVTTFDVFKEDMPYFGQDIYNAYGKLENNEELTQLEARLITAQQKAQQAIKEADVVVFAFPLWNLTIPAPLHTFFDYTYAVNFGFKYNSEGKLVQLLTDKKSVILNARGGIYSAPEAAPMEMAVNYVRNVVVNIFGMALIDEVIIEGHNANPQEANAIVAAGIEKVKAAAHKVAALVEM